MEQYYILLVGILFVFAIFDLIVGVSNDAVNFLNSAIGAKAAPFWVIMLVASLGILGGAVSSNGMMEVARSGIFAPSMFSFHDIMIIFIGVMITDVLLLDTFSSLGMPTSTTVSIVFELLGGAVAMALVNLNIGEKPLMDIFEYINTENAIRVITGIFSAIVIAFIVGGIVQWIVRFIFSFNYEKGIQKFGSLYGGIAVTVLIYFMIIKGAKHATFMTDDISNFINSQINYLWIYSIISWTIIIQLLKMIFNINILKFVVLAGTFSLALAFAGNDLVNFIGVPLAGLSSFTIFVEQGAADDSFTMEALAKVVQTPTIFLLIAGMVMVITLWFSKKARNVTKTTLNLSNQSQGQEQFGSSVFARVIVRAAINTSDTVSRIIPTPVKTFTKTRFERTKTSSPAKKDKLSFDLLRASVNLIVASMLITIGTSYKLPLSTTYVTFMVAMASSFADGAWGRETAVYRITGVLTVISGWFLTAFIAFSTCAIVVYVIHKGALFTLVPLFILTVFVMIRSKVFERKKAKQQKEIEAQEIDSDEANIVTRSYANISSVLLQVSDVFERIYSGFNNYSHQELKEAKKRAKQLDKNAKALKDKVSITLHEMNEENLDVNYNYVQVVDYLREMARSLSFIANPSFSHVSNNHRPLLDEQKEEFADISLRIQSFFNRIIDIIESSHYEDIEELARMQSELFDYINKIRKRQMKRVKTGTVNTRNSLLYLQILHEAKQIVAYSMNIIKSHRDLVATYNISKF